MTDKELQKLKRRELLELLIGQVQENEKLKAQVASQEAQLKDRSISLVNVGSMAEAAMALNHVFEDADKAVAQYKEAILLRTGEQQEVCDRMLSEAKEKAEKMIRDAEEKSDRILSEAEEKRAAAEVQREKILSEAAEIERTARKERDAIISDAESKRESILSNAEKEKQAVIDETNAYFESMKSRFSGFTRN